MNALTMLRDRFDGYFLVRATVTAFIAMPRHPINAGWWMTQLEIFDPPSPPPYILARTTRESQVMP